MAQQSYDDESLVLHAIWEAKSPLSRGLEDLSNAIRRFFGAPFQANGAVEGHCRIATTIAVAAVAVAAQKVGGFYS